MLLKKLRVMKETPVTLLLSAVRRGTQMAKWPMPTDSLFQTHLELSIEKSTLFIRPTVDRGIGSGPVKSPKVTALSMAALAFERGTEDLDETERSDNSILSASTSLISTRSTRPMGTMKAEPCTILDTINPRVNAVVQEPDDVLEISTFSVEETKNTWDESDVKLGLASSEIPAPQNQTLSVVVEERDSEASSNAWHQRAGVVDGSDSESASESDGLHLEDMHATVPGESEPGAKESTPYSNERRVRDSNTVRFKAAARRAKAELRAAAAAATKAASSDDPERLSFLGLATEHDKQTVRPPLLGRRVPLEAFVSFNASFPSETKDWAKDVLARANATFQDGRWHRCVLASSAITTSAADTATYWIPALELRAACWMKLKVWHQLVADCTMTLQSRGVTAMSVSRAYARRAHARLKLSQSMLGDAAQHANFALIDAKLGWKCERKTSNHSSGCDLYFDDEPGLLRVGVLRGLGKLRAARMELESAKRGRPSDWRLLWCLGDVIADEAGVDSEILHTFLLRGDRQPSLAHQNTSLSQSKCAKDGAARSTNLDTAVSCITEALVIAAETSMLCQVPLELMVRYGEIQLTQLRQNHTLLKYQILLHGDKITLRGDTAAPRRRLDELIKQAGEICNVFRPVREGASFNISALAGTAILQVNKFYNFLVSTQKRGAYVHCRLPECSSMSAESNELQLKQRRHFPFFLPRVVSLLQISV